MMEPLIRKDFFEGQHYPETIRKEIVYHLSLKTALVLIFILQCLRSRKQGQDISSLPLDGEQVRRPLVAIGTADLCFIF